MKPSAAPLRALLVLACATLILSPDARGACTPSVDFGQLTPSCGGSYCYVVSPGDATADSLVGSFWSFGSGAPATGQGIDNGGWPAPSWLFPDSGGLWIGGDWSASSAIDGCIVGSVAPGEPAEIMVALFEDQGNGTTYFAAASARRVISAFPEFDFTFASGGGTPSNIVLEETPGLSSLAPRSRDVYDVQGPAASAVAPAIFGDGSLQAGEVVAGYRVYMSSAYAPGLRRSEGWTAVSGVVPLGVTTTLSVPCPTSGAFSLTDALVLDSGFETSYLASHFRHVICNPCSSPDFDKDGDGWPDGAANPECFPDPETWDCDDTNPNVHPFAAEACDGLDDDCNGVVDDVQGLALGKGASGTTLDWTATAGAPGYDVQSGDLAALRTTAGDFSAATSACLAASVTAPHTEDDGVLLPGQGAWYLVRTSGCVAIGTYDDRWASRVASRDPGIASSGEACP